MEEESPHTRESTPVPPQETGPVDAAWDPKDPGPRAPSFPTVPTVEHMRILMKYLSMIRRLDEVQNDDIDALKEALREAGSPIHLSPKPETPIIGSIAWDDWARECFDGALAGRPRATPMPLPFLFRSHDELFADLARYRREGEAWFNVLRAARTQLGLPDPVNPTERKLARPQLPDFVPNAVPSFGDDPSAPPLLRPDDAHLQSPPATDATAPDLIRGFQYRTYATVPRQTTEDFGQWSGEVLFLSNVEYIPLPPRNVMPVRRKGGHFGAHELSRYAQWQEHGKYHRAFIPTCADGEVHRLLHQNLAGNMAWYELDLTNHCVDIGNGRYLISRQLHGSLTRDWNTAQADYVRWAKLHGVQPGMPQGAFLRGKQSLGYLSYAQSERDLHETIAGFQRYLQEVRGWNNYQQCCSELRDVQRMFEVQGRLLPPSLTAEGARKAYRGVFTWSEDVAKRIAQFGVPVFFMAALRKDQQVDPTWRQVSFLLPQYERAVWDEVRVPSFLAGAQESRPLPVDDSRGFGEPRPDNSERGGFDDDDTGPLVHDDEIALDDEAKYRAESAGKAPGSSARNDEAKYRAESAGKARGSSTRATLETSSTGKMDSGSSHKRKAESSRGGTRSSKKVKMADGSAQAPAKETKGPAQVKMPRHPYNDVFAWPSWFPHVWNVAQAAAEGADHSAERWESLYSNKDELWPMSDKLLHGRELMAPQIGMFARASTVGSLSRFLASYAALRARYFHQASTTSPEKMHRFSSAQWRDIHKGFVHRAAHIEYGIALGLYETESAPTDTASIRTLEPRVLQVESPSAVQQGQETSAPAPPARPSTPEFSEDIERSAVFPITSAKRRSAAAQETKDFDVRCFVHPLPANQRALATEDARYLHEPDGWRRIDAETIRPFEDFFLFLEDDTQFANYRLDPESDEYEAGRYFLMRQVLRKSEYGWMRQHDLWWNYPRGWILGFRRLSNAESWRDKPLGYLAGERLTKPLKFFRQEQQYGPKEYFFDTLDNPVGLRVWQARPWHERLPIDPDPLGKVGCLTRRLPKFVLDDETYERVHGIPKVRSAPTDPTAADESNEASAMSGTTSATKASSSASGPKTTAVTAYSSSSATVFKGKKPGKGAGLGDPNGWDLVQALTPPVFRFEHHELPAYSPPPKDSPGAKDYEWVSIAWRRYLIWDAAELLFRFEVFALDVFLREAYPQATALAAGSTLERRHMVCDIWQGNDFLPSGPSPLTASNWEVREPAVRAFAALVRTWPRTSIAETPEVFEQASFEKFERSVWAAYAQTYTDYHWREAPFPCLYPNVVPF